MCGAVCSANVGECGSRVYVCVVRCAVLMLVSVLSSNGLMSFVISWNQILFTPLNNAHPISLVTDYKMALLIHSFIGLYL